MMEISITNPDALTSALALADARHRATVAEQWADAAEELRVQQQRAHRLVMDSQQREIVALRERAELLAALCDELLERLSKGKDTSFEQFVEYEARLAALGGRG